MCVVRSGDVRACDKWLCCDQREQEQDSQRMVFKDLLD